MFYLHLVDGSSFQRGNVIVISGSDTTPAIQDNISGEPITDANGTPRTYKKGWMLGPVDTQAVVERLAISIAQGSGYKVLGLNGELVDVSRPFLTDTEIVQAVMTTREAEQTYGLAEGSARKAIHQKTIAGRKSAGTWLISRAEAEYTWGKKNG